MLTALHQRHGAARDGGDLEILVTYFIERDPSAESFTALLAQYADDPRPGIAEAAARLHRSWQRESTSATALPFPPLAEVLRTIGGLLDDEDARYAHLSITSEGVRLLRFGEPQFSQRKLDLAELRQEIAARTALRGQLPPVPTLRRERLLRAVGSVLAQEPAQDYDIIAMPRAVVVEGSLAYYHVFSADELEALAMASSGLPGLPRLETVRTPTAPVPAERAAAAAEWAVMDAEAYRNQLGPWLGPGHAAWLARHSSPGPTPGFTAVACPLYEAFLARRSYRGITPEEETRLGLPHRTPPPFARDVYRG